MAAQNKRACSRQLLGIAFKKMERKCLGKKWSFWKRDIKNLNKKRQESSTDLVSKSKKLYPSEESGYRLKEEVGYSSAAIVFKAFCIPCNETVAIKIVDLEKCDATLDEISYGICTLSLMNHPNVVQVHCSFMVGHHLWIVMPYMNGGSCLHIMKASFPTGYEESIIAFFLQEVLKGLLYIHRQGQMHRNIKAGNILVDARGTVALGDFWFSTEGSAFDNGTEGAKKALYWNAPELKQHPDAYNPKADIWSIGITALELSHGPEAFDDDLPLKVLDRAKQRGIQGNYDGSHKKFSKSFIEMVSLCLAKDPRRRPSTEKLLKHSFFVKYSQSTEPVSSVLSCLPPLCDQLKTIKDGSKNGATVCNLVKGLSQNGLQRMNSGWNFEEEATKILKSEGAEANKISALEDIHNTTMFINSENNYVEQALYTSPELMSSNEVPDGYMSHLNGLESQADHSSVKDKTNLGDYDSGSFHEDEKVSPPHCINDASNRSVLENKQDCQENKERKYTSVDDQPDKYVMEHVRATKEYGSGSSDIKKLSVEKNFEIHNQPVSILSENIAEGKCAHDETGSQDENMASDKEKPLHETYKCELSSLQTMDITHSPKGLLRNFTLTGLLEEQDKINLQLKKPMVEQKGRFKVTTRDTDEEKTLSTQRANGSSNSNSSSGIPTSTIFPFMQKIAEHNDTQRDQLVNLIRTLSQPRPTSVQLPYIYGAKSSRNGHQTPKMCSYMLRVFTEREHELLRRLEELQSRVSYLDDEIQKGKLKNIQLERQLSTICNKEESEQSRAYAASQDSLEKVCFHF